MSIPESKSDRFARPDGAAGAIPLLRSFASPMTQVTGVSLQTRMKQRDVLFRRVHNGHQLEVVRWTQVISQPFQPLKVERSLQAFVDGVPVQAEAGDRPGLQHDLVELSVAIATHLPAVTVRAPR